MKVGEKMGLTSTEICKIIKTARQSGVSELKFGELSFSFAKKEEKKPKITQKSVEITAEQLAEIEKVSMDAEKTAIMQETEDQLEILHLEDPNEYEKLLARGELEGAE